MRNLCDIMCMAHCRSKGLEGEELEECLRECIEKCMYG